MSWALVCIMTLAADFNSPVKSTWLGGAYLASNRAHLKSVLVSRQDYQEHGSVWLAKVFSGATVN